jgi:hypothetical protein
MDTNKGHNQMDTKDYTHAVIYWNYKAKAWLKRGFTNEADAVAFYNVRMERALKNAPKLSNGMISLVQATTPKMRTL